MARRSLPALLVAACVVALAPVAAEARSAAPRLVQLRCVPAKAKTCRDRVQVRVGRQVQLRGRRLYRGMRVTFRWRQGALATKLERTRTGWIARVPAGTRAGRVAVYVRDRGRHYSNRRHLHVLAAPPRTGTAPAPGDLPEVFRGDGMWIWVLAHSDGGDPAAIGARARAAGIETVFVKSSDGATRWAQFTPDLVAALHAQGLRVCAWQFVYGSDPTGEASAGASAVQAGADCLVADAESDYEGRYAAAQRYLDALRGAIGEGYPLGLTSFPYVDYHSKLPYSVFLAPGGAQANLPQVYWKAIGGGVDAVSAHTYAENRVYATPIAPLGQTYDNPPAADIQRFRQLWASYGSRGLSWWSWQATSDSGWATLGAPAPDPVALPDPGWPVLDLGAKGDQVIWLQQHLASVDATVDVNGRFDDATDQGLRNFQASRGLPVTGATDGATWQQVLTLPLRAVDWTTSG